MPNEYEERQEAKRERLLANAAKAEREAASRFNSVDRMSSVMNGQPILIGHHSENRHRRDIERMDQNMRKGVEATNRAKELKSKALSVGQGGISSDDPEAVPKLQKKLEKMTDKRDKLKKVNAL